MKKDELQNISELFLQHTNIMDYNAHLTNKEDTLTKYQKCLETGEFIVLNFNKVESETGDLSTIDDDVLVVMPADQISGKAYELRYKAQKLAEKYCVQVIEVDKVGRKVIVSHHAARMEKRAEIEEEINRRLNLKRKSAILVKGKVLKIQTKHVNGEQIDTGLWLDLCGVGIPGFLYIGNWSATFTQSLKGKVFYGDVIEVIIAERVERNNGMHYYACSRKELVQNPWDSKELNEQYHEGDIVRIKCLSLSKNNWFGEINGLEDIQVFTEYPSSSRNFAIVPGMEYMGKIYHMDTKKKSLKARVFQALTFLQLEESNQKNTLPKDEKKGDLSDEEKEENIDILEEQGELKEEVEDDAILEKLIESQEISEKSREE